MYPRYAIYYAPAPGSRWWRFGCEWLGRDAISGKTFEPIALPEFADDELAAMTAAPRRYGFHATLKAPFALASNAHVYDLHRALRDLALRCRPLDLGRLRLHDMDGFLALRPVTRPTISALARTCVEHFDFLRAAPTHEELARRRGGALTARQEELLLRWGYPYVLEEFRFHLTLTDVLAPERRRDAVEGLSPFVETLRTERLYLDALCLYEQSAPDTAFRLTWRYGFDGTITHYQPANGARGRLIYVVGPSGAGKDSLLQYVKSRVSGRRAIAFAHRYITRPADSGGENHIALDEPEFLHRRQAGAFALHWQSHGNHYGVGIEIDQWMRQGLDVVVNGSRAYLAEAHVRYPDMTVVWITAPADILEARLCGRGRENSADVKGRLARAHAFEPPAGVRVIQITNDATLDRAGEQLVQALTA